MSAFVKVRFHFTRMLFERLVRGSDNDDEVEELS